MAAIIRNVLLSVAVAAVVVWIAFDALPDVFAPERSPGFGPVAVEDARRGVRTSALQLLAGVVLAAGAVFTARTVQLTRESNASQREGQITERYSRAVTLLGEQHESVRLGGVYALERIARDSARDHATIMDVLTGHARVHGGGAAWEERVRPDVEAAVSVVGRRAVEHDAPDFMPILSDLSLARARLRGVRLDHSRMRGTNLRGALLDRASLVDARLEGAQLQGASLNDADLRDAHLQGADLQGAHLWGTRVDGAVYDGATSWPPDFPADELGARQAR